MRGKLTIRTDDTREIEAGTQIRDGLDSFTVERKTTVKRGWLARLLGLKPRAVTQAIREDRIEYWKEGAI